MKDKNFDEANPNATINLEINLKVTLKARESGVKEKPKEKMISQKYINSHKVNPKAMEKLKEKKDFTE